MPYRTQILARGNLPECIESCQRVAKLHNARATKDVNQSALDNADCRECIHQTGTPEDPQTLNLQVIALAQPGTGALEKFNLQVARIYTLYSAATHACPGIIGEDLSRSKWLRSYKRALN